MYSRIHHSNIVVNFLSDNEVPYIYLPSYSPDYMPIELTFGAIKKFIQCNETMNHTILAVDMIGAINRAVQSINEDFLFHSTVHCIKNCSIFC